MNHKAMEESVFVSTRQSSWTCPSCGSTATTRYCGQCGERQMASAFTLIWQCALFPAVAIVLRLMAAVSAPMPSHRTLDQVVSGLEVAAIAWYLFVALATAFALSMLRRALTTLALVAALYVILLAYHVVVFTATLYSI